MTAVPCTSRRAAEFGAWVVPIRRLLTAVRPAVALDAVAQGAPHACPFVGLLAVAALAPEARALCQLRLRPDARRVVKRVPKVQRGEWAGLERVCYGGLGCRIKPKLAAHDYSIHALPKVVADCTPDAFARVKHFNVAFPTMPPSDKPHLPVGE